MEKTLANRDEIFEALLSGEITQEQAKEYLILWPLKG